MLYPQSKFTPAQMLNTAATPIREVSHQTACSWGAHPTAWAGSQDNSRIMQSQLLSTPSGRAHEGASTVTLRSSAA